MKVCKVKRPSPPGDVYNFKDLKVTVTGFRTQKNEAPIPGTGICLVERATDIPGEDPSSVEESQR